MMELNDRPQRPFECVDPEVGGLLPLFGQPDIDPALRGALEDHLMICDACRLDAHLERRIARGLKSGTLSLGRSPSVARSRRTAVPRAALWSGWGGAAALAAAVALAAILPPRPASEEFTIRAGVGAGGFVRPVEGEVLYSGTPRLAWSTVPGATAYELQVWATGGDYHGTFRSSDPSVRIPAGQALPSGGNFRALVRPVPADLAGPSAVSVSFRRDDLGAFLAYRLVQSAVVARAAAGVAAVLLALALVLRRARPV